jgi:hypothetical protein
MRRINIRILMAFVAIIGATMAKSVMVERSNAKDTQRSP